MGLREHLSAPLGVTIYFADAHSPWPQGSNENTNGALPNGASLNVHPAKLRTIQNLLNGRPMPVLSGATRSRRNATPIAPPGAGSPDRGPVLGPIDHDC